VYVDEAGQDDLSEFFIVVSAVCIDDPTSLRTDLLDIERQSRTNGLKWHKSRHDRRMKYLSLVLTKGIAKGLVFMGKYQKPVQYFFPMASLIEHAIKDAAPQNYLAIVHVDGINKKVATELTNALRATGVSLRMVKNKTDDGEVLIRLADMWAGCARNALLGASDSITLLTKAKETGYLQELTT
jgi:hypothetical protein